VHGASAYCDRELLAGNYGKQLANSKRSTPLSESRARNLSSPVFVVRQQYGRRKHPQPGHPQYHRPDPRVVDDALELGALDRSLRGARHRAVGFTPEQFHYGFANTLSREDSDEVYERYHIPAPGSFIWAAVLANFEPGHQEGYVNYKNDERAALLLIAGGEDHLQPASVNESNFKHYRNSSATTDYHEFAGRSHYTVGEDGWEEVADYALDVARKRSPATTIGIGTIVHGDFAEFYFHALG
jgi:pimeloyl-ACP methyl ester carboxylesterase